jgi:Questin oxidase-like
MEGRMATASAAKPDSRGDVNHGAFDLGRAATTAQTALLLDEAFDRVATFDFEIPNPFINHAPMACEALVTLGLASTVNEWVDSHVSVLGAKFPTFAGTRRAVHPVTPTWSHTFSWKDMLGDYRLLPEWMGYFERAIDDDGWREVVRTWVGRLMPGLASALFHGVIRTSHAVRALDATDTGGRRAELARALGSWAVWFGPGQPTDESIVSRDPQIAIAQAAAEAAGCYVAQPNIVTLHGVTGAMAVHLLSGYVDPFDAALALTQLEAEHRELYHDVSLDDVADADGEWDSQFASRAVRSSDPHQIKLVEACLRGLTLTGNSNFIAAARRVTAAW